MTVSAFASKEWATQRRACVRIEWPQRRAECRALQIESTPKGQKATVYMAANDETDAAWQGLTVVLPDGGRVEIRGSDFYNVDVRRADGSLVGWLATDAPTPDGPSR